jgi:hypothetical protein
MRVGRLVVAGRRWGRRLGAGGRDVRACLCECRSKGEWDCDMAPGGTLVGEQEARDTMGPAHVREIKRNEI